MSENENNIYRLYLSFTSPLRIVRCANSVLISELSSSFFQSNVLHGLKCNLLQLMKIHFAQTRDCLLSWGLCGLELGKPTGPLKKGCLMFADGPAAHRRYEIGVVNLI